jgi:hypothetical protein
MKRIYNTYSPVSPYRDDLESARYELKDRQIGLAIERRALASEQRIRGDAIRYLALMDAREDQVISLR